MRNTNANSLDENQKLVRYKNIDTIRDNFLPEKDLDKKQNRNLCKIYSIFFLFLMLIITLVMCLVYYQSQIEVLSNKTIFRPLTDRKNYKAFLLTNSLKVLLISNPNSNISAASLSVGVGSFSNPPNMPGLAHFLEHMLFRGNKKCKPYRMYLQLLLLTKTPTRIPSLTWLQWTAASSTPLPVPPRPTTTSLSRITPFHRDWTSSPVFSTSPFYSKRARTRSWAQSTMSSKTA